MRKCCAMILIVLLAVAGANQVLAQESIPPEVIEAFKEFARGKARQAQTRANMRTIQIAVESYATDSGGLYPKSILECRKYLSGD